MNTKQIIDELVQRDWSEADLRHAARLLEELERSPESREALRELEQIRQLLKSPSSEVEPAGGWVDFERRLRAVVPPPGAAQNRSEARRWRGWIQPVALAAALALAAVGWYQTWHPTATATATPPPRFVSTAPTMFTHMTSKEVDQQAGLFDHVSEVFDDRAKWVAVSDTGADMGLAPAPFPATRKLLLLRLAVLRGGKLLSRSDLAIVPGQDADMTLPFENGQSLRYRVGVSAGTPRRLSLWVEVKKPGDSGKTLAILSTELAASPGESIRAGDLTTSSGDYQFQLGFFEAPPPESKP